MLAEDNWYNHIGDAASKVKQKMVVQPLKSLKASVQPAEKENQAPEERSWEAPKDLRQWKAFDFAEIMEEGISPGLSSEHIQLPERHLEVRLCVQRLPDRMTYMLSTKKHKTLLLAKVDNNIGPRGGLAIYVARDGDSPAALGPAFHLETAKSNDKQWILKSVRCEECEAMGKRDCGVRELARITHYTEVIGEGHAFCMDVEVPMVYEDGDVDVWCSCCGVTSRQERHTLLTSRRPKWNPRRKSLTLDFRGRCSVASAKNFQLEVKGRPGKSTLLFGKVSKDDFVLDYAQPLGEVQAFAAALTSALNWK
eukprot:TRINITY_DN84769_c0_g1_i1.p1 TRINITY_DN84769_c0_g1~~TRINITY_DN84769_c0_g1_i1.p1  ORF type:complete len:309 (-),score=86.23 TRINITY_DN84769_c0_g1_i1:66-992(-)